MIYKRILGLFFLLIFACQIVHPCQSLAGQTGDSPKRISYGETEDQIGATVEGTELEGPKSFLVDNDTCYILDSVKKRIAIYTSEGYKDEISIAYCLYPQDIAFDGKDFFILDNPDQPRVYQINTKGDIVNELDITIPTLDKTKDCLQQLSLGYDNTISVVDSAYNEYALDLVNKRVGKASKGIANRYNNDKFYGEKDRDGKRHIYSTDLKTDIIINPEGTPSGASILGYDKFGNIYIFVVEMSDLSEVVAEYTVRKFDKSGNMLGIARIPIEEYYYTPIKMVDITSDGAYIMLTGSDNVEIRKLIFSSDYTSNILKAEKNQAVEQTTLNSTMATLTTFNSRQTTNDRAWAIDNCYWYYAYYNYQPVPSGASRPDWLSTYNVNLYGIPYCWGGFDAMDRHSAGTSWSNYVDAMNKQKFAGNVTCSGGYKTGTAGLDCSGYCGACLGYTSKPSTYTLWADSHSHLLSERGLCDIYINQSQHVLFFISEKTDGTGVISAEATTAGDDKCKIYSRTYTWLTNNGYSLRSFW